MDRFIEQYEHNNVSADTHLKSSMDRFIVHHSENVWSNRKI